MLRGESTREYPAMPSRHFLGACPRRSSITIPFGSHVQTGNQSPTDIDFRKLDHVSKTSEELSSRPEGEISVRRSTGARLRFLASLEMTAFGPSTIPHYSLVDQACHAGQLSCPAGVRMPFKVLRANMHLALGSGM